MADPIPPSSALIQEELSRLIDSDALRRAPSHARLLRYLVESRVAGDETALRETSIALEVFRRDPSTYDPRTDPIVRVTTGRLRDRLVAHYAGYDAPKVRIVLPKGRYAPEFVAQDGAAGSPFGLGVLRTRNHTGNSALDGYCNEFADQLADRLARLGLPRVMARGSVDSAEALSRDTAVIGAQLHVPWLLDSTLSREHEQELRLSVRLVHATDGGVRWVETSVGAADDVYRLLDRMLDVASLRTLETLPAGAALRADAGTPHGLPTAQRAALEQARLLLLQRTVAGADQAIALAASVAHEHPDAAEAWAMVAAVQYSRLSFQDRDPAPIIERLRAAADRALALDPDQPMALRTKAILLGKHDYDAAGAESLFQRALRALPHYTSARINYARASHAGREVRRSAGAAQSGAALRPAVGDRASRARDLPRLSAAARRGARGACAVPRGGRSEPVDPDQRRHERAGCGQPRRGRGIARRGCCALSRHAGGVAVPRLPARRARRRRTGARHRSRVRGTLPVCLAGEPGRGGRVAA